MLRQPELQQMKFSGIVRQFVQFCQELINRGICKQTLGRMGEWAQFVILNFWTDYIKVGDITHLIVGLVVRQ